MAEQYRAIELPISDDNYGLYSMLNNQIRKHYQIDISYLTDVQIAKLIIHMLGHIDLDDTSKDYVNLDVLFGFAKKTEESNGFYKEEDYLEGLINENSYSQGT